MLTTEGFLAAVKRAIGVPSYQARFSNADILAFANEEQQIRILPMLTSVRENYNVVTYEIPVIPFENGYRIPARSVGRTVRELFFRTADNQWMTNLAQINLEDTWYYSGGHATPSGFTIEGDKVRLWPIPNQTGTLVCKVVLQLSQLVESVRTGVISSVGDNTVTLAANCPSNITINNGSNEIDITLFKPGYSVLVPNAVVSNIDSQTILTLDGFSSDNPLSAYDVQEFCIVSTAGETSIIQLPNELHPVLIHATAERMLEGLANPDRLKQQVEKTARTIESANKILQPRSEGESQKVFQRNGLLAGRWYGRYPRTQV